MSTAVKMRPVTSDRNMRRNYNKAIGDDDGV